MSKGKVVRRHVLADPKSTIRRLSGRADVSIFIDFDGTSQESKMGSCYSYDKKDKILRIVANELAEIDKPLLMEVIQKSFANNKTIIRTETDDLLTSYQNYASISKDKQLLRFFKDIIPTNDYSALKMSLYLRYQSNLKANISGLKTDIRYRFGDRGVNIANLCSTGYFEEFKDAYNKVTNKEQFLEYYELVVGAKAKALFVSSQMSIQEIDKGVTDMVDKAIRYRLDYFRIHAKGRSNVDTIKNYLQSKQNEDRPIFTVKKIFEDTSIPAVEYEIQPAID